MRKLKVGVIGVGRLGSLHAKIYHQIPEVQLIGVHDIDISKSRNISKSYNTNSFPDYQKLLDEVDAVSIAVPTSKHFEIAKACFNKNVHTLIEKPVTSNLSQAKKLLTLATKSNSIIQVGHIERFNAAVKAICKMPDSPRFIECHRLGPFTERVTDVSVTIDLMIHDIDIILELVKSKIKKIDAVGIEILSEKNDIANARITFEDNTVANLTSSRVSKESMRKIRIFQKEAYVSLDYSKQQAVIYKKRNGEIIQDKIQVQKEEPLRAELNSFIKCIKKGGKPLVSIKEATRALKIAVEIDNIIEANKSSML